MGIIELSKQIHDNARDKGFWDKDRNVGEMLMLIVSEASEAMEADRIGKYSDWLLGDPPIIQVDQLDDAEFKRLFESQVKGTMEDELADVVIRCMDFMYARNADLEWHIKAKMRYNKMRPHMHGKKY